MSFGHLSLTALQKDDKFFAQIGTSYAAGSSSE